MCYRDLAVGTLQQEPDDAVRIYHVFRSAISIGTPLATNFLYLAVRIIRTQGLGVCRNMEVRAVIGDVEMPSSLLGIWCFPIRGMQLGNYDDNAELGFGVYPGNLQLESALFFVYGKSKFSEGRPPATVHIY